MRSRVPAALALSVTMLGSWVFLFAGSGPASADAARPVAKSSAPSSAPSHPLTIELPGLATVSVDVPDVPALLGAGRNSSQQSAPAPSQRPDQPTRSDAPRPSAHPSAPASSRTVAPATSRPAAAVAPRPVRSDAGRRSAARTVDDRQGRGAGTREAVEPAAAHKTSKPASKPAAPAKARPLAAVFEGMLHRGLPVWMLAGIVAACGLGTVVVVRSAGRKSLT